MGRARGLARVSQIVDYIFWVIYALLGMRFLLALLAARLRQGGVRVDLAYGDRGLKGALLAPSAYLMKSPPEQYSDVQAHEAVERFIRGELDR